MPPLSQKQVWLFLKKLITLSFTHLSSLGIAREIICSTLESSKSKSIFVVLNLF